MILQRDDDERLIRRLIREEAGVIVDCEDFAEEFAENLRELVAQYKENVRILPIFDNVYNKPIQLISIKCNFNVLDMDLIISVYCLNFYSKKSIKEISEKLKKELDKICKENIDDYPYFIPLTVYSANKNTQNTEEIEETLALTIERLYRQRQKEKFKRDTTKLTIKDFPTHDDTATAIRETIDTISINHLMGLFNKDKLFFESNTSEEHFDQRKKSLECLLYKEIEKLRKLRRLLRDKWRKDKIKEITRDCKTFLSQNALLRLIDHTIPTIFRLIALSQLYSEENYCLRDKNCIRGIRCRVLQRHYEILRFGI